MLRTKFRGNLHTRSGEEKIWRVFIIYWHGGHLGYVTSNLSSNFNSLYLKAFIQNMVQNDRVFFEKIWFDFLYEHDLGPRARNDLDLQYSHTFINSIRCHTNFQFTGCNSFWKIHCFQFFLWKSPNYKIWPCRKIGQGHSRVIIWTNYDGQESQILHTKVSWKSACRFRRRFLKVCFFLSNMGMAAILV